MPAAPQPRVLHVDDNPVMQTLVRKMLGAQGMEVVSLSAAEQVAEKVRAEQFDLVILDILMPALDGITLCRQLRSGGYHRPVLFVTSLHLDGEQRREIAELDASCLSKPFGPADLVEAVRYALTQAPP